MDIFDRLVNNAKKGLKASLYILICQWILYSGRCSVLCPILVQNGMKVSDLSVTDCLSD